MPLKIKELREEHMFTQKKLAEKLNSSQKNISNWETGISEPDLSTIERLADVFNVSIDELFGREPVSEAMQHAEGIDRLLIKLVQGMNSEKKAALLMFLRNFVTNG